MYTTLTTLINRLDSDAISNTGVLAWGSPVPSFGDLSTARVATLGLNPSNREFVDDLGNELQGKLRRLHTLKSLGLTSWSEVDTRHIQLIEKSCLAYFHANPYDRWFKILDQVVSGTKASYYSKTIKACHLDLIPYATTQKWTELNNGQRSSLLSMTRDTLGLLVKDSAIEILILNGKSVVDKFQEIANIQLESRIMPTWSLRRSKTPEIKGFAYFGYTNTISDIQLGRDLFVLGFNHNLQSSFGVTTEVIIAIKKWISQVSKEII
jgi:hypothetical protein